MFCPHKCVGQVCNIIIYLLKFFTSLLVKIKLNMYVLSTKIKPAELPTLQ